MYIPGSSSTRATRRYGGTMVRRYLVWRAGPPTFPTHSSPVPLTRAPRNARSADPLPGRPVPYILHRAARPGRRTPTPPSQASRGQGAKQAKPYGTKHAPTTERASADRGPNAHRGSQRVDGNAAGMLVSVFPDYKRGRGTPARASRPTRHDVNVKWAFSRSAGRELMGIWSAWDFGLGLVLVQLQCIDVNVKSNS